MITYLSFAQDSKEIIGKPIKIGNLLVAQYDFPKLMNWDNSKKSCEALGDGWRLPTQSELNILYQNKVSIGGFANIDGLGKSTYWSSTEYDSNHAWGQSFYTGFQDYIFYKYFIFHVRAVRSL